MQTIEYNDDKRKKLTCKICVGKALWPWPRLNLLWVWIYDGWRAAEFGTEFHKEDFWMLKLSEFGEHFLAYWKYTITLETMLRQLKILETLDEKILSRQDADTFMSNSDTKASSYA